ncbi:7TM domain-containing protein [Erythrobacter sp. W302b]|uniref:7TM domain-containing protein n=1 Tax=Erythrobacter sp. W302b TaxID=3389874 RepID=UPI00396B341A
MRSDDLTLPGDIALQRAGYALAASLAATFGAIVWALFDPSDNIVTGAVIAMFGDPSRPWDLPGMHLLLVMPLGATVVVFVRSVLGWKTFGLFTPMLLALAYLQSGPIAGPVVSTCAILVGMLAVPFLKLLNLSRVGFLGTLIAIVVSALGAMALKFDQPALVSAFPVVVTALIVERWWNAYEADGPKKAVRMTIATLGVAIAIQLLVAAPPVVWLATELPLGLPLASTALMIVLGRYQGLRLSEIARFRAAAQAGV